MGNINERILQALRRQVTVDLCSLVNPVQTDGSVPWTAASRRMLAAVAAPNGKPTSSTDGFPTTQLRLVHFVVDPAGTAGDTVDYRIWVWLAFAEKWVLDTRVGACGTRTVTVGSDATDPEWVLLELGGAERVYVELLNFSGVTGVDVWGANASTV